MVATVLLKKPDGTLLMVYQYRDPVLAYEEGDLAAWFGLGAAEISVDHCVPPPAYYLRPMTVERAVGILRWAAEDRHNREMDFVRCGQKNHYLVLNEAVSHTNHATGIVKQYPDISTGKSAEC